MSSQKGNIALILLVILLFIISVTSAYYLGSRNHQPSQINTSPSPSPDFPYPDQTPTDHPVILQNTQSPESSTWKIYHIKALNLEFKLPPSLSKLGELEETTEVGLQGNILCIRFKDQSLSLIQRVQAGGPSCFPKENELFLGGGDSIDYHGGTEPVFIDYGGFKEVDGKYIVGPLNDPSAKQSLIQGIITNPNGIKIVEIMGDNQPSSDYDHYVGYPYFGTLETGWIGIVLNTPNKTYPGIAFQIKMTDQLNEMVVEQILSTFKFTQ